MINQNNKKQSRIIQGLFFIVFLTFVLLAHFYKFKLFFWDSHVSQHIFSLLFLNSVFLFYLFQFRQEKISISPPQFILMLVSSNGILFFLYDPSTFSILCLYLLCILLFTFTFLWRYAPLIISYSAVASAVYSLGLYFASKLHVCSLPSDRIYGNYAHPNLLAALMLMGLFNYSHLISVTRRKNLIYLFPSLLLASVLFMTESRAAMVALCVASLLVLLLWRNENLIGVKSQLVGLFFVLVVAFFIAQAFGSGTPLTRAGETWAQGGGTYMRLLYWLAAVFIGFDHWLCGAGFGGYAQNLGDYAVQAAEKLHLTYDMIGQTLWAHNDFLQIFAEHGLFAFLLILFFVCMLLVQCWKNISRFNLFIYLGIISFVCMMCFGHPLYYHNLALMVCLMITPIIGRWRGRRVTLPRRYVTLLIVVTMIFINAFAIKHFLQMYGLHQFRRYMIESNEPINERFRNGQARFLTGNIDNQIYGWRFKNSLYTNLVRLLQKTDNRELGRYVLPAMVEYSHHNRFPSYLFSLAKLYYILGDYENAQFFANQAFERKPDVNEYFDLVHLCNSLLISKNNDMNIEKLISTENLDLLYEQKVLLPRQFNSCGIAL